MLMADLLEILIICLLHSICDRVRGNQAFGHAIDIRIRACIVSMVYLREFCFFALKGAIGILESS